MEDELKNKLYLHPLQTNTFRKRLNPIRHKILLSSSLNTNSSKSVSDILKGLNGSIIMQNWNTKNNVPKDIGDLINCPTIIDTKKMANLKKLNISEMINRSEGKLMLLDKINKKKSEQKTVRIRKIEMINDSIKKGEFNKINIHKDIFKKKLEKRSISNLLATRREDGKSQIVTLPLTERSYMKTKNKMSKTESYIKINIIKKTKLIDFSTFKSYLFLKENDFLYAKRVGGPFDFVLCSYQDINPNFKKLKFKSNIFSGDGYTSSSSEYLTISRSTILHYIRGKPHIYVMSDWINDYIKYKQLMKIPLIKNFKNAKLFELWKKYYRNKKRMFYLEKFKQKTIFVEPNLLKGILEIRKIFKDMTYYELFKLNISSPVYLNKFNQIHSDVVTINISHLERFRTKIKKEISSECRHAYLQFKKENNITLDDPVVEEEEEIKEGQKKKQGSKKNNKKNSFLQNDGVASMNMFLKDAVPYAQDATRKRYFRKILKYIRLIDFLFGYAKVELIKNSLRVLGKRLSRSYECYKNQWNDVPILIIMIVTIENQISYTPAIELIKGAFFDNFIHENINLVINLKNFVDPEEFPQYMICFEDVFDVSVDQNNVLGNRIKYDDEFNNLVKDIQISFGNCQKAMEQTAYGLTPSLINYNKFIKLDFNKIEKESDHNDLNNYLKMFKEEGDVILKLKKKINIGIFEFNLEMFLEQIVNVPFNYTKKIYEITPKILSRKVDELHSEIETNFNSINFSVPNKNIELFIKLKKAVEFCVSKKGDVEDKMDEIQELNNIIVTHKDIKYEDFERKKYDRLTGLKTNYERKMDSMIYFIDQNIKQFKQDLISKIKKYEENVQKIHDELNEELINKYNEDTVGPILLLEEKSLRIEKAMGDKKLFQQQEIDIDMEENNRSDFENLDLVKYDYDLKLSIWKNLNELKTFIISLEKQQIMEIDLNTFEVNLKNWKNVCVVAVKDLDGAEVASEFLSKIKYYEKILHILKIIHNDKIQNISYLRDLLKNALGLGGFDFSDNVLTFEKLITLNGLFESIPTLDEINLRANEEHKIKEIYKNVQDSFIAHHIPLVFKVDNNEKGFPKYIINPVDFDKEQEFIEQNLSKLNHELLNPYITVIENDFRILVNNIYKYQFFLDTFYEYQIYMLNVDDLIFNSDFAKEFPAEFKKLSNESLTKSLIRILKDCMILNKYIEYGHERAINNLRLLINNYEQNFKSIRKFLNKKRRDIQEYYLLSDEELINLIVSKDSYHFRQKLLLKLLPYIGLIDPGKETDENVKFITKDDKEEIVLKYHKATRTLKDGLECIELGLTKKMKDILKNFKKNFDNFNKTKMNTKLSNIITELIENKDKNNNLYQLIFICTYHSIFYNLEKCLEKEKDAFDKMFDFYHELKDWAKQLIKMLKKENNNFGQIKLLIAILAIIDYFVKSIENLIRDDVTKTSDFSFNKVLQIKIENDLVNIKLLNFNFEYGNEYVGLKYDFFILPETEKTLLSMFNALFFHNPFLIYNNQSIFKKELLNIASNVLGKNIFYFTANKNFGLDGLDNVMYGNMKNGSLVCIKNIELMEFNLFKTMVERINEIFGLIRAKSEEGYFTDRNYEKYAINIKKFNLFLSYDIDSYNISFKNSILPMCVKSNFRNIGINYIDFYSYVKLLMNSYQINRANEISSKIKYIITGLIYKGNLLNKKNLKEKIFPLLFEKIKNNLLMKLNEINKKSIYNVAKECILNVITPFLNSNQKYKEDIETLINITLFDYEELEKKNNMKANKKTKNNPSIKEEPQSVNSDDLIFNETLQQFGFSKNNYVEKIKTLYNNLNNGNSFVLLGPSLSGKSNAIVLMKEISLKLNKIDNVKYQNLKYIKIYPNFKSHSEVFYENNIMSSYQSNNIYFNNMIKFLQNRSNDILTELHEHYKTLFNINNDNIVKEETKNKNNKPDEEEKNEFKLLILDGNLSFEWCSFLTNYLDNNNNFSLSDGNTINLSKIKLIYETTTLSKSTPSFITKQNIISFDYDSFDWFNICYAFLNTNSKTAKNEELKIYIKGLFENYLPKIIEFILNNKIKTISFCINKNFIIKNVINIFDAFLPDFDFTDIKIGRRNYDYVPRIDVVKNQTLTIFIFCCSWIMNLLTNFLIKNKIEKAIGDIFKSDDLKGPIFDYYLDEKNSFCLWSTIYNEEKYPNPSFKKNTVYYYDHNFVYNLDNFKYIYIFQKMIQASIPILFFGKSCTGLSTIINKSLAELETKEKTIKQIKISATYDMNTNYIEKEINTKMDKILRRVYGDKFKRQTLVYIDDIHLCGKSNNFHEYIRYLLNEKLTYDNKENIIKFYRDLNLVNSGNYFNNLLSNTQYKNNDLFDDDNETEDFIRYTNQFSLITLNLSQQNYVSIYKPTMEFHFRTYIPNISNIISNQYLSVLFKINELLNEQIKFDYTNLHYFINIRDITKIVQQFNKFIFRGSTEFTEYLKKIFLYESYCLYSDKFNNKEDIEIFKNILVSSFNSSFKQDKLELSIFDTIDKDDSFIYCKNFLDIYEENKEGKYINPKDLEYVYIEKKSEFKKYVISKVQSFYGDYFANGGVKGTEDLNYRINEYNDYMINSIIRLLRILDNEYPNILLIGSDFSGKETLVKIALYIMRYNYVNASINKLMNKTKDIFEQESIIKTLADVVFNNKKIFLIFQHDLFNNSNEDIQMYIFELISSLLDPNVVMEKFKAFKKVKSDNDHFYNLEQELSLNEMKTRIKNNLQIILSINYGNSTYRTLFLNYPNIVKNFYSIFIKNYNDDMLKAISTKLVSDCECSQEIINNKNIFLDIYNFVKIIYESYSKKLYIDIPINQRNYMSVCDFFSKNYKAYKDILLKKKDNYTKVFTKIQKANELVEEKEKLIVDLMPSRENNDKTIEEIRKKINVKNAEKNKIKDKRKDEDKLLKNAEKEKETKINALGEIFSPYKENIRKIGGNITKFTDKDIVECKNTWEAFQFGKFLLTKIFLFLGEANGNDYDFIKKNISPKYLKRFINLNYATKMNEFNELIKEIEENPDNGGLDKYNKNYRLAGLICEYISAIGKYYQIYNENSELRNEISSLEKDIEERKILIMKHEEEFKGIDKEIDNMQIQIDNLETNKNNIMNQLDKHKSLISAYKTFIETTKGNGEIWKEKKEEMENILKYFDYYMIFISSYAIYAPILNYNNRQKLKNYILQIVNVYIEHSLTEQEKEKNKDLENEEDNNLELGHIKNLDFVELMYNIFDLTKNEKNLYSSSNIYKDFIRENYIFMYIFKEKTPFIIDYTHYAKSLISEYLEFSKLQNIQVSYINENSFEKNQDFKDKVQNCVKNGGHLYLDGANNINQIYYYFYYYINGCFTGDKYKKFVMIDDHKYNLNDNFKLYVFKNSMDKSMMKIDQNIYFNMLIINFNIRKEDIKDQIFIELSKKRNELSYNSFKKLRNNLIKQSLMKIESENKMINLILQIDISGNIDKLQSTEAINEKYKNECQLYLNIISELKKLELSFKKQRVALNENYGKLSRHASVLFKWIFKFNLQKICYLVNPDTLIKYLMEFYDEKIETQKEYNEIKKRMLNDEANKLKNLGENIEGVAENEESEKEEEKENDNNEEQLPTEGVGENIEVINPVLTEEFIYTNKEDIKSLFIFFYNKLNKIYTDKDLNLSFVLLLSILCHNFQNQLQIPFKNIFNNYYLCSLKFDELIEKDDIKESPIINITTKQWTLINKINTSSGDLFQNLIDSIENNKEIWNTYLSENLEGNIENHYYINELVLPDKDLESNINQIIKLIFFLIVKQNKKEFIVNKFIHKIFKEIEKDSEINKIKQYIKEKGENDNFDNYISQQISDNLDNYDLITTFKNFNLKRDNSLLLMAPKNDLDIYDNFIYTNFYLKMFSHNNSEKSKSKILEDIHANNEQDNNKENMNNGNKNKANEKEKNTLENKSGENEGGQPTQGVLLSNDIKYKEIILDNNDLSPQDYDFIKSNMKYSCVIIIKHAEFLGNVFTNLLNDIETYKAEEVSSNFKLILIYSEGEVLQNKLIYEKCKIISDNFSSEQENDLTKNDTVKNLILNNVCKITKEIYSKLLNNTNIFMRLFLRKLIFHYLLLFGVLQKYLFNNPFSFSYYDFYCICKYIINFFDNEIQSEDKYKDFMNLENNSGYNYQSLIQVLNNTFIISRQINYEDKSKINKLINHIFNKFNPTDEEHYLNINDLQIKASQLPVNNDIFFKDIYKAFNSIFSSNFENILLVNDSIEISNMEIQFGNQILENIYNVLNTNIINNNKINEERKWNFNMSKINQLLLKMDENIPYDIPYLVKENAVELDNQEAIDPSLFKKNKYGIYNNGLDEILNYELVLFNKKLAKIHQDISNIKNIIKGEFNYKKEFFDIFNALNKSCVPSILNIYNDISYLNTPLNISKYMKIIKNRISLYKEWLRGGCLNCYHLPIFTNIQLFIYCLKMNFCRKYYGDNNYSKITPDRIMLKFIYTKFKTYEDLSSNEKSMKYYKNLYKNEIIWVDGLMLNNANINVFGTIIINNKQKNLKNKMNIVGITYNVEQFFENNNDESESVSLDEEDEENSEFKDKESEEQLFKKDYKIKVYIYGNDSQCLTNKYYDNEAIGFIEFETEKNYEQDFIFENDVRITIEDLEDFN